MVIWVHDKRCGDCRFFDPPVELPPGSIIVGPPNGSRRGHCRVEPPRAFIAYDKRVTTQWPNTDEDHPRCSRFIDVDLEGDGVRVELPVVGGGQISVTPGFGVMAVQPLTANTCRITVAGVGRVSIALSYADCIAALEGSA